MVSANNLPRKINSREEIGVSVAPLGLYLFRRYLGAGAYAPAYVSFAPLGQKIASQQMNSCEATTKIESSREAAIDM